MENTSVEHKMENENEKQMEFIKFKNGKGEHLKQKISASTMYVLFVFNSIRCFKVYIRASCYSTDN